MSAIGASWRTPRQVVRREYKAPAQLSGRIRILPRKCMRQFHIGHSSFEILVEEPIRALDCQLDWLHERLGQHRPPVLVALARTHRQFQPIQIHILDPQTQRLLQSKAGAIHQRRGQPGKSTQLAKQSRDLLARQHYRYTLTCLCTLEVAEIAQVRIQHLGIEECQCVERKVLRRGCYMTGNGQPGQKLLYVFSTKFRRITPTVESNDDLAHQERTPV